MSDRSTAIVAIVSVLATSLGGVYAVWEKSHTDLQLSQLRSNNERQKEEIDRLRTDNKEYCNNLYKSAKTITESLAQMNVADPKVLDDPLGPAFLGMILLNQDARVDAIKLAQPNLIRDAHGINLAQVEKIDDFVLRGLIDASQPCGTQVSK